MFQWILIFVFAFFFLEDGKNYDASVVENKNKTFRFNFNAHNVFNCDSSEDEEIDTDTKKQMVEKNKDNVHTNSFSGYKDTLFFEKDDARFNGMHMNICIIRLAHKTYR